MRSEVNSEELQVQREVPAAKYALGVKVRPVLRLGYVEDIIGAHGIITPVPSRQSLIRMIESGEIEGRKFHHEWFVYEDSFRAWVRDLCGVKKKTKKKY